jgi:hypothetical protein
MAAACELETSDAAVAATASYVLHNLVSSETKMRLATAAPLPAKFLLEASAPAVAAAMLGLAVVALRLKPH